MGDFGLAEDVYASGYFKQNDRANVKLPYKWMALESLDDAIFTEKTDVVSVYGTRMHVHDIMGILPVSMILTLPMQDVHGQYIYLHGRYIDITQDL